MSIVKEKKEVKNSFLLEKKENVKKSFNLNKNY